MWLLSLNYYVVRAIENIAMYVLYFMAKMLLMTSVLFLIKKRKSPVRIISLVTCNLYC